MGAQVQHLLWMTGERVTMPSCPTPPSLSVFHFIAEDPLRATVVSGILLALLCVAALGIYQARTHTPQDRRERIALGAGSIGIVALVGALFVDLVVYAGYDAAKQQWLLASFSSASPTCLAAIDPQLARMDAVETRLRVVEYTAGVISVIGILAMLSVNRFGVRSAIHHQGRRR